MLTPDCVFNERGDKYAFVLENSTDDQTYVVYSDEPPIETDHELLILLYGDEILDEDKGTTASSNAKMQVVLQKAKELNEKNSPWHHHLLSPDCIFNKHEGKWNIFFENAEDAEVIEVLYEEDPVDDLRRIEILFFERAV